LRQNRISSDERLPGVILAAMLSRNKFKYLFSLGIFVYHSVLFIDLSYSVHAFKGKRGR
jgi:hypothetical protein